MVKITIENVVKRFGNVIAVNNISLEIKDKEFFVLLGPSGCGKSTTLNIIAGLERQDQGSVYFDDEKVDEVPPEKRDVAMVFQSYALYPHMTAYRNIAFPLMVRKVPSDKIRKQVMEAAQMLGIESLLDRKPYELSGGERQRVALARAIVRNPKAFLLDEPLSNIDAKLRVAMRAELIRLQKTLKTTTIYVTHDQVEAMTMADRIAIMNKGKVAQLDEPIRIFDKPADTFVAGFIGSPPMNFFHCSLMEEKEKTKLKTSEFSLSLPSDVAALVKEHGNTSDLILAVRPQNISVSKQRLGDDSFETEVYAVEPLGTETIVDLTVGGQIVKSVCPPTFKASLGEKVWAKIDIAKIHVYDRKTEKLIV